MNAGEINWHVFDKDDSTTWPTDNGGNYLVWICPNTPKPTGFVELDQWMGRVTAWRRTPFQVVTHWMPIVIPDLPSDGALEPERAKNGKGK